MTIVIPESITAEGNVKAVFVPAIANVDAPSLIELNAAGSADISCHLMPDWGGVTADQATGESRRFCSTETFTRLGRVSRSVEALSYTYLPQEDLASAGNEVYSALQSGVVGFLVIRYGIPAGTAFAVADVVDVVPIEAGVQIKAVSGADEFAPLTVTQTLGVTGLVAEDAVVAA